MLYLFERPIRIILLIYTVRPVKRLYVLFDMLYDIIKKNTKQSLWFHNDSEYVRDLQELIAVLFGMLCDTTKENIKNSLCTSFINFFCLFSFIIRTLEMSITTTRKCFCYYRCPHENAKPIQITKNIGKRKQRIP